MIDCILHTNRPVLRAITLSVIHDIFLAAIMSKPKYSVLVLGKTQSGKSCLIEHIKNYADPDYAINQAAIGAGNTSMTESVQRFYIDSNLPAYEVAENTTGAGVDLESLDTIFTDKDDYQDQLNAREKDYTLRVVPPHPDNPSPLVEFTFLDTPGFNDTNNRDMLFTTRIIDEVIASRSFNLILVVVSCLHPLSMEYGYALEYYAKVLQGLHSNIAFLYTHVSHTDCHHSNTRHHTEMAARHRAFSSIFQHLQYTPSRDSAGPVVSPEIGQAYRYFNIDLHSRRRPIIQCLIRKTLRDILQLAIMNPPAVLDTSNSNINRIQAIVHPDAANYEFHERRRQEDQARPQGPSGRLTPLWFHDGREELMDILGEGHLEDSAHMESVAHSFLMSDPPSSGRSASSYRP